MASKGAGDDGSAWAQTPAPEFHTLTIQDVIDNGGLAPQNCPVGSPPTPVVLPGSGDNDPT